METCFNYCNPKLAFFSSDERKWITRVRKLKEQHPDQVQIIAEPETNDGCIYCKLPADWLRIGPKRQVNMSDERKQELAERLRELHRRM
jgi:hypothetical protein